MVTEHEYRELNARIKKLRYKNVRRRQPLKFNNQSLISISLAIFLIGLFGKNFKQFTYNPDSLLSSDPVSTVFERKPTQVGNVIALKSTDYSRIDQKAATLHYAGASVSELASLLSQSALTEVEKARIAYAWIAHHVAYDVSALNSNSYGDLSPKGVLQSRQTVCSGYANLFKALAEEMDLEAVVVEGYAKGVSYLPQASDVNHAWNAVKLNGAWYLLDTTWGAGIVENGQFRRQFTPHYFAVTPEQLVYSHLPKDASWQLLPQPFSKQAFDRLPEVSPQFFHLGLGFASHQTSTLDVNGTAQITLTAPEEVVATARLSSNSSRLDDTYSLVQRKNDSLVINAAFPRPGTYQLEIFAREHQESGDYPHVLTYHINAHAQGKEYPRTFAHFSKHNVSLQTPLVRHLPSDRSVYFELEVPKALNVQVLDSASQTWTALERSGSLFRGYAPVGKEKVQVLAQFPGSRQYWTLAEYN